MEWLKAIAPTIATAMGGPLAGLAVKALGDALNLSDATKDSIANVLQGATLSAEQMAAVKQAELALQQQEREMGFRFADLEAKDRDSARNREIQVKDGTNRNLAYGIVGAFIALVGATLMGWAKVDSALAGTLVGYLSAKAEQVLAYYFGSTAGSARKSELLAQSQSPGK
jgi:hypothetical protein